VLIRHARLLRRHVELTSTNGNETCPNSSRVSRARPADGHRLRPTRLWNLSGKIGGAEGRNPLLSAFFHFGSYRSCDEQVSAGEAGRFSTFNASFPFTVIDNVDRYRSKDIVGVS
jgi:hypothetical protein